MIKQTIRPYEMSLWSLKDIFIMTLKAPGIENMGHIEEPSFVRNLDGTLTLNFKIPMYYNYHGEKKENPFWYDVKYGALLVGMRKIKVILNKQTSDEEVFEFLITDVNEQHLSDGSTYCDVECSGLPFEELGKKGYKISLSMDELEIDVKAAEEKGETLEANINYWCDKVFADIDWDYTVEMDYGNDDNFVTVIQTPPDGVNYDFGLVDLAIVDKTHLEESGITGSFSILGQMQVNYAQLGITRLSDLEDFFTYKILPYNKLSSFGKYVVNNLREKLGLRRCDKIYEDEYVSEWSIKNNQLIPSGLERRREKCRVVDESESNIYNLTQIIAENFGVYCDYKYYYDDNYHIIKKQVVFYNHLIKKQDDILDLNYSYNTSIITREMDSKDICTKLIVSNTKDDSADAGLISISNCAANKSGEDYLLNFDYLYTIHAITEDQYQEVSKFENKVGKLNRELQKISNELETLSNDLIKAEAKQSIYNTSITQATDNLSRTLSELDALTNGTGIIETTNRITLTKMKENSNMWECDLTEKGILLPIKAYYTQADAESNKNSQISITESNCRYENGNIVGLRNLTNINEQLLDSFTLLLKYSYRPAQHYINILNTYNTKRRNDEQNLELVNDEIAIKEERQEQLLERYNNKLLEKAKIVNDFEKMMGPAIREGTWSADSYKDFYSRKHDIFYIDSTTAPEDNIVNPNSLVDIAKIGTAQVAPSSEETDGVKKVGYAFWDIEHFDGEQLNYYESGVNQDKIYYPYIILTPALQEKINELDEETTLRFAYATDYSGAVEENNGVYSLVIMIGTEETTFTASTVDSLKNQVLERLASVLYNTSAKNLTKTQKTHLYQTYGLPYKQYHYFTLGSNMVYSFISENEKIIPILLLIDETGLTSEVLNNDSKIGYYTVEETSTILNNVDSLYQELSAANIEYTDYNSIVVEEIFTSISSVSVIVPTIEKLQVFPRYKIPDLSLDENNITIISINKTLEKYEDYSVLTRENAYYITIKNNILIPDATLPFDSQIFKSSLYAINFQLSNAELSIYLDAKEVSKTNAFPQVSYTVTTDIMNEKYLRTLYKQLGQLVHINDPELKFENVMGYVNSINMSLDKPWEDSLEIKNYKTKFEDLFSRIIASTQQLQANQAIYNNAAYAFDSSGLIRSSILQESLGVAPLNLNLIEGTLNIDTVEGIRAISDEGIVMMNGGGIYCATEQDDNGNWKWHSGILPSGINASLIKTGQLDTNLIKIYAGQDLRFQLNANGLFAYKTGENLIADTNEYVVHNGEGLFLTKKIDEEYINLVEVSWDGFIIRNEEGNKVFYADEDGNLTLSGTIQATNGFIAGWKIDENTLSNPDETYTWISRAGIASGGSDTIYNWINKSAGLYKVFWAGLNEDNSHRFYVDSNGNVTVSSIIVENTLMTNNLLIKGLPIDVLLPELNNYEQKNIYLSPLDGLTFYKTGNNYGKETLQFIVSANGFNINLNELTFWRKYKDVFVYEEEDEDEEYPIQIIEGQEEQIIIDNENSYIQYIDNDVNTHGSYLTFAVKYDILGVEYEDVETLTYFFDEIDLIIKYNNYIQHVTLNDSTVSSGLTVVIESDAGIFFQNGSIIDSNGEERADITLRARVYRDNNEINPSLCRFKWYKQDITTGELTLLDASSNEYNVIADDDYQIFSNTYVCDAELREGS